MRKVRKALIFYGVIFFIIAITPLIGTASSQVTVLDRTNDPITINEASSNGIQEAYAYPLTLKEYQKAEIEFSMSLPNSSTTLKILDKETYERNFLLNNSPEGINGEDFLYIQEAYRMGGLPSNHTTIYEQGSRHIRFSGGIYGSDLVYKPGNYVVLVYGDCEEIKDETLLTFNLLIRLDGPGDLIELVLITICLLFLISYSLIITLKYIIKSVIPYKKKIKNDKILLIQT